MLCLIYVSSATRELMTRDGLADLMRTCRANNEAAGVTGLLLYAGGNIMQVLEGDRDAVETLYDKIGRDPRHKHPTRMIDFGIKERQFADWSMALCDIGDLPPAEQARCRSLMASWGHEADPAGLGDELAILLDAFREVMRVPRRGALGGPGRILRPELP
jgi:hypothetical protein